MAAIRSQSASAPARSRPCRSTSRCPGPPLAASINGRVIVPSSRSVAAGLAGPLRRPGDVEDVVEQLKGEADVGAEPAQLLVVVTRAGRRTRRASRSSAGSGRGSAVRRSSGRRRRGAAPARPAPRRPRRRRGGRRRGRRPRSASRAKAREKSRSPVATARLAARAGGHGRPPRRSGASSSTSSWTRVAMWTARSPSPRATAAAPPASPGAEQDQHRPQPLAAGRKGRARVLGEQLAVLRDRLPQLLLDLAQPRRQPAARRVEHRRHRRRHGRASGHPRALAPLWIAMIPPASTV